MVMRTGRTGTQEGAVAAMFTSNKPVIDQHLERLRAEAAARRALRADGPSVVSRIVATVAALRDAGTATETASTPC